jgi:hypothetical protein
MMGSGSPQMVATGQASFDWTDDGLWPRGEFEQDQSAGGRLILTWKAHYLAGWDPRARDDVAFRADNCDHAGFMRRQIDGDRSHTVSSMRPSTSRRQTTSVDKNRAIGLVELTRNCYARRHSLGAIATGQTAS